MSTVSTPKAKVGGLVLGTEPIEFNVGRKTITLKVRNTGDRPIQVGSHFHFLKSTGHWNLIAMLPMACG